MNEEQNFIYTGEGITTGYTVSSPATNILEIPYITYDQNIHIPDKEIVVLSKEDYSNLLEIIDKHKYDKTIEGKLEKLGFTDE